MVERAYSVTPVHPSVSVHSGVTICFLVFQSGEFVSFGHISSYSNH